MLSCFSSREIDRVESKFTLSDSEDEEEGEVYEWEEVVVEDAKPEVKQTEPEEVTYTMIFSDFICNAHSVMIGLYGADASQLNSLLIINYNPATRIGNPYKAIISN